MELKDIITQFFEPCNSDEPDLFVSSAQLQIKLVEFVGVEYPITDIAKTLFELGFKVDSDDRANFFWLMKFANK